MDNALILTGTHARRWLIGSTSSGELLVATLKLVDSAALTGAFVTGALLTSFRPEFLSLEEFLSMRMKLVNVAMFLGIMVLWRMIFMGFQLYDPTRSLFSRDRLRDTFLATTVATFVVGACGYVADISLVSFPFLVIFGVLANGAVLGSRFLFISAQALRGNSGLCRILVVGTGPQAIRFAQKIDENPDNFCSVIGFCDEPWRGIAEFHNRGYELVTEPKTLRAFLRENIVDEVVMTVSVNTLKAFESDMLKACEEHGVTVRFLSNILTGLRTGTLSEHEMEDGVVVSVYNGVGHGGQFLVKRMLDVVISLALLVALIPIFLAAAVAIRWDSRGPIFFTQTRVGLNKRPFRMYKFRTMENDAEEQIEKIAHLNEVAGPAFKVTNDPRVTRIGPLLRVSSIDELPQLVNVLKGEMSLVGPRPLPLRDFAGFDDDRHRRRFSVIPGLTGLWQVSGRSSTCFEDWMQLDLEYVENWSLSLDLKILARTVPAVLKRVGAS